MHVPSRASYHKQQEHVSSAPVQIIEEGGVGWRSEEIQVPDLKVRPEMAQVIAAVICRHPGQQIVLGHQAAVLCSEALHCVPQRGNGLRPLDRRYDKSVQQPILLQHASKLARGRTDDMETNPLIATKMSLRLLLQCRHQAEAQQDLKGRPLSLLTACITALFFLQHSSVDGTLHTLHCSSTK